MSHHSQPPYLLLPTRLWHMLVTPEDRVGFISTALA